MAYQPHYFLREDLDALDRAIQELDDRIHGILSEMGGEGKDGGNTWHDNFDYEEGQRGSFMWSNRLRELIALKASAELFTPPPTGNEVLIGRTVTIEDETTKETRTFQIGSFMVMREQKELKVISYVSPLAKILIGARTGDYKCGQIGETTKCFRIVKVE